jgi:hypothetical protein
MTAERGIYLTAWILARTAAELAPELGAGISQTALN